MGLDVSCPYCGSLEVEKTGEWHWTCINCMDHFNHTDLMIETQYGLDPYGNKKESD